MMFLGRVGPLTLAVALAGGAERVRLRYPEAKGPDRLVRGRRSMTKRTFAVIGLGRFGFAMATTLAELGHEVIGIDSDEENVARISDYVPRRSSSTPPTRRRSGRPASRTSTSPSSRSARTSSPACWSSCWSRSSASRTIIAKATTAAARPHSREAGRLARRLPRSATWPSGSPTAWSCRTCSTTSSCRATSQIVEMPAPAEFVGRTLRELALRPRFGLTLIAIKRAARDGQGEAPTSRRLADDEHPGGRRAVPAGLERAAVRTGGAAEGLRRPP